MHAKLSHSRRSVIIWYNLQKAMLCLIAQTDIVNHQYLTVVMNVYSKDIANVVPGWFNDHVVLSWALETKPFTIRMYACL